MDDDRRPAIEVRIGSAEVDQALRSAEIAAGLGVDRIGVGTPLIYRHGFGIIPNIRERAGALPILANLAIHDGCYRFLVQARRHGAEWGTVSAIHNYAGCREAVRCRADTGLRVLADLTCIPLAGLPRQAREIAAIGVDGLVVSLGHDAVLYETARRESDGVAAVADAVSVPVGCVVTSLAQAQAAAEQGAGWLILDGFMPCEDHGALEEAVADLRARTYAPRRQAQAAAAY